MDHNSPTTTEAVDSRTLRLMHIVWGCGGLVLFAVTWRLWLPNRAFPQVPLVEAGQWLPLEVDYLAFASVVVGCILGMLKQQKLAQIGRVTFCIALAVSVIANQHRIQPWAYQLWLMAIVFSTCHRQQCLQLLRILTVSIYIFSAVSKLDYQFSYTVGTSFVETAGNLLGLDFTTTSAPSKARMALTLPLFELLAGVLLIIPASRKPGVIVACLMHLGLLLIVGPAGLSHEFGVLIWNMLFLALVPLQFLPPATSQNNDEPNELRAKRSVLGVIVIGFAVLFPLTEPFEICDNWLAWGLYAPRSSRVDVYLDDHAAKRLPASLQGYLSETGPLRQLHLDRYSLDQLGVPLYPQARFQLGVATAVLDDFEIQPYHSRIVLHRLANRWTGARQNETLGELQLQRAQREYFRLGCERRRTQEIDY